MGRKQKLKRDKSNVCKVVPSFDQVGMPVVIVTEHAVLKYFVQPCLSVNNGVFSRNLHGRG